MVIKEIPTWNLGEIVFSKDQGTITFVTRSGFHTYDRLSGELVCEGKLLPSSNHQLGAHWVDETSILFAISSKTEKGLMIDIQELQPTSDPPLNVVKSFLVPSQVGQFSFSLVSFHAAFVSDKGVVILDAQDSKVLLQSKGPGQYYSTGHFSYDGHFFACGAESNEIYVWENTPTGYVSKSDLRARSSLDGFSWSPTSNSILCWSRSGIQLLQLDNYPGPMSPVQEHYAGHLVAYSADWTYAITGCCWGTIITVLDLSNGTQQSIDTGVQIVDIKITNNTIFMIGENQLINLHLETGEQVNSACAARMESMALHVHLGSKVVLSDDCSQIAFTIQRTIFLYDVKAQKVLGDLTVDGYIVHIQFSPDGSQMGFIVQINSGGYESCHVELERGKDLWYTNVTITYLAHGWSLDSLFQSPYEHHILGGWSEWVLDSRGNVLWLPITWRTCYGLDTRWNGNFLALMGEQHPEPIIIEFKP